MKPNLLNCLFIACISCYGIACTAQTRTGKAQYRKLVTGNWVDVSEPVCAIAVSATKWTYHYKKQKDICSYFFLHNSNDTIGVLMDEDTLVYHIESVDSFYLSLNYLGMGLNKDNWSNKILEYRRK